MKKVFDGVTKFAETLNFGVPLFLRPAVNGGRCQILGLGHEVHAMPFCYLPICTVTVLRSPNSSFILFCLNYFLAYYLKTSSSKERIFISNRLWLPAATKDLKTSARDDSLWGSEIQLPSSHSHDPNIRALIIIYGICFVAALAIEVWAIVVEKNSRPLRWGILIFK